MPPTLPRGAPPGGCSPPRDVDHDSHRPDIFTRIARLLRSPWIHTDYVFLWRGCPSVYVAEAQRRAGGRGVFPDPGHFRSRRVALHMPGGSQLPPKTAVFPKASCRGLRNTHPTQHAHDARFPSSNYHNGQMASRKMFGFPAFARATYSLIVFDAFQQLGGSLFSRGVCPGSSSIWLVAWGNTHAPSQLCHPGGWAQNGYRFLAPKPGFKKVKVYCRPSRFRGRFLRLETDLLFRSLRA